jgi:3-oxoacyl-[acyl-carrier-protein] synthase III
LKPLGEQIIINEQQTHSTKLKVLVIKTSSLKKVFNIDDRINCIYFQFITSDEACGWLSRNTAEKGAFSIQIEKAGVVFNPP